MKNISLTANAILILAVGFLYYLHFKTPTGKANRGEPNRTENFVPPNSQIVFINIDSLLHNYQYYTDLSNEFSDKRDKMEAELKARTKQYEASAMDYQNKVQKGLVTRREAADLEQQLLGEQQNLYQLNEQLTMQLAEEEQVSNRKLINNIMEFLKVYNQDYNYQFIFSNSFGDNVLYADLQLDITTSVLEGLNKSYSEQKAKK